MRESTALTISVASQRKEGSSQEVNRLNEKGVFSGSNKDGTARGTIWFKGDSKAKPVGDYFFSCCPSTKWEALAIGSQERLSY